MKKNLLLILLIVLIFNSIIFACETLALKSHISEISSEHQKFADILKRDYGLDVLSIKELSGGSCNIKPLLITTLDGKKYVFKFLTYHKKDLLFFLNFNLHLQNNGINIHKIYPTKDNQYFSHYSSRVLYCLFEYFDDFKIEPFSDYFKVGNMLASLDNIMLNFRYQNPRQYKSRIQIMKEVLVKTFDPNQILDIVKIIQFLDIHKDKFLKLCIHNDLHSENVDVNFRIIDIGIAQYDWRICNFINIFFSRGNSKFDNLELIRSIAGYNQIALKPLNFHEMLGILYVLKSRVYEDLILCKQTFLKGIDCNVLEKYHYAALALKSKIIYQPLEMDEHEGQFDIEDKVIYFNFWQMLRCLVIIKDGKFFDIYGNKINTNFREFRWQGVRYFLNSTKFVMDVCGNIFLTTIKDITHLKHSHFLAGRPVAHAGMIDVTDGTLITIDTDSGHYKPRNFHALQVAHCLLSQNTKLFQINHLFDKFLGKEITLITEKFYDFRYNSMKKINQFTIKEMISICNAS